MSQVSQLPPEVARGVLQLARALLVAARNWTLYPPEHPAVAVTVDRLYEAIRQSSLGAAFGIGITPDTLLIDGIAANNADTAIAEAAALLHDRDLVHITFLGDISRPDICALLCLLALDANERRQRGGPEKIWATEGHPSMLVEQVDYSRLFAAEGGAKVKEPATRDDLWRSIVMNIAGGQKALFDEKSQQRLLEIAGNPTEIWSLTAELIAPKRAADGSPMIMSQAAIVLAAFRHLTNIVSVMSPDRMPDVMNNLAAAAAQLDPHLVMQLMQAEDSPDESVTLVKGITSAFDDVKVAQLLATALALDGQASDRLATIFNTIAPDEERKRRVLTLARSLLSETDFGKSDQFQTLWTSTEKLLVSYNDKPFVSQAYRSSLDGLGGRAERMAVAELPPELPEWMQSLGQESVRRLSVRLLIDLLTIERDPARADDIAHDMEALGEDLIMSGAYDDALSVVAALNRHTTAGAIGREACRLALDQLGESLALRETMALLTDFDDASWRTIRTMLTSIGQPSIEALKPLLATETPTLGSTRAAETIVGFGPPAVARLASLVGDERWFVQRSGAEILGRIGTADAVPLLQPLLRRSDPRVTRAAASALSGIQDPSAARAIHNVLRSATGAMRRAVIDALVADRDPRVVPMLARILRESRVLGRDHEVVLETIAALGTVGTDQAVPPLVEVVRTRGLFRRKRRRAVKQHGVQALMKVATPRADAALDEAARIGDQMLKKVVAAGRRA